MIDRRFFPFEKLRDLGLEHGVWIDSFVVLQPNRPEPMT